MRQNDLSVFDIQRLRCVLVLHQPTVVPKKYRFVVNLPHLLAEAIDELPKRCVYFDAVAVLTPVFINYNNS